MKKDIEKLKLIYILATSFSGTTLIGYILGSSHKIENLGELKLYNRQITKGVAICTCGQYATQCKIWNVNMNKYYPIVEVPSLMKRLVIFLKIIFKLKFYQNHVNLDQEYDFLFDTYKSRSQNNPQIEYLLDNSKSIWRLIPLLEMNSVDVTILYVKRNIYANVQSFKKHGFSFYHGLFIYKLKNFLIKRLLENNPQLHHITVDYDELCTNTDIELQKLGEEFDISLENYIEKIASRDFHIATGNIGTQMQFVKGFDGIRVSTSWKKKLSSKEKNILKKLS